MRDAKERLDKEETKDDSTENGMCCVEKLL